MKLPRILSVSVLSLPIVSASRWYSRVYRVHEDYSYAGDSYDDRYDDSSDADDSSDSDDSSDDSSHSDPDPARYTHAELRAHFDCGEYARDQGKPLPTPEVFGIFREKYREHVDPDAAFDDPVPPTAGYALGDDGRPPPYVAGHSAQGRGRGLFATRDIRDGELVHDGAKGDVSFPDADAWRRFVLSLPREMACDQLEWSWTQRLREGGAFGVHSAINISILMNTGDERAANNVRPESPTSRRYYATRDIARGEELLYDYFSFDVGEYEEEWEAVGL